VTMFLSLMCFMAEISGAAGQAETIASGSTQLPTWLVYGVGALVLLDKAGYYIQKKRNGKGKAVAPEFTPGIARECRKHNGTLIRHDEILKQLTKQNESLTEALPSISEQIAGLRSDLKNGRILE